jgi:hypothetical protein
MDDGPLKRSKNLRLTLSPLFPNTLSATRILALKEAKYLFFPNPCRQTAKHLYRLGLTDRKSPLLSVSSELVRKLPAETSFPAPLRIVAERFSMKVLFNYLAPLSVLLVLSCAQGLHADSVNNVVTDFSAASNPNGVWTYDYNGVAFDHSQAVSNLLGTGLPGWSTGEAIPNLLFIAHRAPSAALTATSAPDSPEQSPKEAPRPSPSRAP